MSRPFVVGVGGFTSNVGKTTLMCELLRAFPGWEAIKTTRGHYRSCGKDPHACCVSHLLSEEPVIRSGREATYEAGKDTGRYWDAGAANVHWLIATDHQIEKGIKEALSHVASSGVFIEGNSFSQFIRTDYFVMVRRRGLDQIKKSANAALPHASAVYISDDDAPGASGFPRVFTSSSLPRLVSDLRYRAKTV
jgi:molybdopterin-guanine dinucleotide biosynthesis protein